MADLMLAKHRRGGAGLCESQRRGPGRSVVVGGRLVLHVVGWDTLCLGEVPVPESTTPHHYHCISPSTDRSRCPSSSSPVIITLPPVHSDPPCQNTSPDPGPIACVLLASHGAHGLGPCMWWSQPSHSHHVSPSTSSNKKGP